MSKKMKIPSIFKNREPNQQQWRWPSCKHPKTLSFRATTNGDIFKTANSVFLESPESLFTNSSQCPSFTTEEINNTIDSIETMIQRIRLSDRLFFEPGGTSSILKEENNKKTEQVAAPFKESVALAMESGDPYLDFRKSMDEMVESHGLKDWDCLEELLGWYLKMNGKVNHGFIVAAFMDLLYATKSKVSRSDSTSYSSPAASSSSSLSSPPCSPLSAVTVTVTDTVTGVGSDIETDHEDEDEDGLINVQL